MRSVKAFYDGAMGSRGAFYLDDYSDQPGHRGVGGAAYGFDADLPATDYNIFYGRHSAVTRQDRHHHPPGGWRIDERMTIEEAIRGWSSWAARATFQEHIAGVIEAGRAPT